MAFSSSTHKQKNIVFKLAEFNDFGNKNTLNLSETTSRKLKKNITVDDEVKNNTLPPAGNTNGNATIILATLDQSFTFQF